MQFGKRDKRETYVGGKLVGTHIEVTSIDKDNISQAAILKEFMDISQRITGHFSHKVGIMIYADPKTYNIERIEKIWTEPEERNV